MKKKFLSLLTLLLLLCSSGAWADTELFSTDFSAAEWSDVTFSQGNTKTADVANGITFYSQNSTKQFSIASGELNFPDNNISSSNYFLAIPITGVNGSITITFTNTVSSSNTWNVKYVLKEGTTVSTPGGTGTATTSGKTTTSATITSLTKSNYVLYIGRSSSSDQYKKIKTITITTPTPAHTVTYKANGGTGSDIVKEASTVEACTFTAPSGKIFLNWNTSAEGNGTAYAIGATVPSDLTLYAQWVDGCVAKLFDLTGEKGSAEVTTATATVNEGTSLVLSNTAGRIKLTPQSGMKFKNGDKIDISGTVGVDCSKNDPRPFGIKIYASDGSTLVGTISYNNEEAICSTDGTVGASGTLSLASDQDYIFIARHGGTTTTLTSCEITRNVAFEYPLAVNGTYGWASFYIDVPVKVPANTTAYYASSVTYSAVEISPIVTNEVIPAYTGVIVSSTDGTPTFTYNESTPKPIGSNKFKGCLVDTPVATETTYVLSPESTPGAGNCVFGLYMGTTLGANKAYMDASDRPSGSSAPGRIFFEIANENNATDINNIESSDKAMKIVENGQIFILRDGHKYDVMGRIVK